MRSTFASVGAFGVVGATVALAAPLALAGSAGAAPARQAAGRQAIHRTAAIRPATASAALIPTSKHEVLPRRGGTVDSVNWAGYAVTPGSGVTGVDSTFIVPKVSSDVPPGFTSNWAGIGGYSTSDLIQAGTSEQTAPSSSLLGDQYYAWWETLPNSETQLTGCSGDANCTVTPGDTMTVNITNAGGDNWTIDIADSGHWTWSKTVSYSSSESSAEWIEEAPEVADVYTIPANTGTATFGPTDTYTTSSGTHTIAAGDPTLIDESPGVLNEATPSALASNGESFDVCAYQQSCAAP